MSWAESGASSAFGVAPIDAANSRMLDLVHPREWPTPPADGVYDLVAIGAGAGGLVSAKRSARRGARSALVEAALCGGDCLVAGCVPSKALLHAAKQTPRPAFDAVMARMRTDRARIAEADAVEASVAAGTDVYLGRATFTGPATLEVATRDGPRTLRFRNAVVATGGRPTVPAWLEQVPVLTNHTVFNLTRLPPRVVVVGAGAVGVELAQAFALLGSSVTLLVRSRVLSREAPEASEIVEAALAAVGVRVLRLGEEPRARTVREGAAAGGFPLIRVENAGEAIEAEVVLAATGRAPNVAGIGLEAAGVAYSPRGVRVDDYLRTTNPRVFAVGDVADTGLAFTHLAGAMADMAIENALFAGRRSLANLAVPRTVYCTPEVAGVGLARERDGVATERFVAALAATDRGLLDDVGPGFVALEAEAGTGRLVRATVVAPHAGEMITELTVCIQQRLTLDDLGQIIHPYPTLSDAVGACCFQFRRRRWPDLPAFRRRRRPVFLAAVVAVAALVALRVVAPRRV